MKSEVEVMSISFCVKIKLVAINLYYLIEIVYLYHKVTFQIWSITRISGSLVIVGISTGKDIFYDDDFNQRQPHLTSINDYNYYQRTMAPGVAPTITLNNGREMPQLGLGTWLSLENGAKDAIKYAIDIGYRHIDCAMVYSNEKEVGEAIREKIADGTVKREDLFITTKLWNTFHEYDHVVPTCKKSLKNLGLDYVDLYLVHWPVAEKNKELDPLDPFGNSVLIKHDFTETWRGMEECVKLGLAKSIGLSNFNSVQMLRILDAAKILPVTNQVEVNPHLNQRKLIKFCKEHNIVITAYSPFGSPARTWAEPGQPEIAFDHPTFVGIAQKYEKTSSQVILRYLIDIGTVPIPKSTNKERLRLNLDVFDFKLDVEDIAAIDAMNMDYRAVPALELVESDEYPFKNVEY